MSKPLGVGLYGTNGHQIQSLCLNRSDVRIIGVAEFPTDLLPNVKRYCNLKEMLEDTEIDLVSLCSPMRSEQAAHAIACINAGKHVYAEKPCALSEEELDDIVAASAKSGKIFREMAGLSLQEPYLSIGEIIRAGHIGQVIQVFAQKSYPYHNDRPRDENVDGGLLLQVGIHALRMVEHVAGCEIKDITALETQLGNQESGDLRMAVTMQMTLSNGGLAAVVANYLNQHGHGQWGNDHLRVFGDKGFVESTDGGTKTRLVIGGEDLGELEKRENAPSYFDILVQAMQGVGDMPMSLAAELHPLRAAIRAKKGIIGDHVRN